MELPEHVVAVYEPRRREVRMWFVDLSLKTSRLDVPDWVPFARKVSHYVRVRFGPRDPDNVQAIAIESHDPIDGTIQHLQWAKLIAAAKRYRKIPPTRTMLEAGWDEFAEIRLKSPGRSGHPDSFYERIGHRAYELLAEGMTKREAAEVIGREENYAPSTVLKSWFPKCDLPAGKPGRPRNKE